MNAACLPAAGRRRVLVVGDVMLDETWRGEAGRLSPEAPVPVLASPHATYALGGAANVAANLQALGAEVDLVGVVGDDPAGAQVARLLAEARLSDAGLVVAPARPTTHKLRVVARAQQVVRVDRETGAALPAACQKRLSERVAGRLAGADLVVCSDYAKGTLNGASLARLFAAAAAAGTAVAVDPKGDDPGRYRGATYLTPNLAELAALTARLPGVPPPSSWPAGGGAAADVAAAALASATGAAVVLVTCGAHGMRLWDAAAGACLPVPARARAVFDVTGAGDTVIAAFALMLAGGASPGEAAAVANVAAGLAVAEAGTTAVTRAALAAAFCPAPGPAPGTAPKCLDRATAAAHVARARAAGQRVVFTNGCFDLLHAGHVRLLAAARAQGDLLVVGLNSDASVRGLKGPARPLVPAADRAEVLAGLAAVDLVVIFDDPTPAALVAALQPDVLVKGADYVGRPVAGRAEVEASGGEVILLPLVAGRSTTGLVADILARHAEAPPDAPAAPSFGGARRAN